MRRLTLADKGDLSSGRRWSFSLTAPNVVASSGWMPNKPLFEPLLCVTRHGHTYRHTGGAPKTPEAQELNQDMGRPCAQHHSDTDFGRPFAHNLRDHPVQAERREKQANRCEHRNQPATTRRTPSDSSMRLSIERLS
jgi:hypothetical protein